MSTPALIAREVAPFCYVGRYVHHDGEPSRLGKRLWQLYLGEHGFRPAHNLEGMLALLLDAHPAGWRSLMGEWSLPARYLARSGPVCLCHGRYHEPLRTLTETTASYSRCEFGYVFARDSRDQPLMRILAFASRWETTLDERVAWRRDIPAPVVVASLWLSGREPDWNELLTQADFIRKRLDGEW